MKKTIPVIAVLFIVFAFLLTGCGASLEAAATILEYDVDGVKMPTINAVVGTREVTGVSSSKSSGNVTKEYTYKSSSVEDDVMAYVVVLMHDYDYIVIEDIDLENVPGTAKLAVESPGDESKVVMIEIDYTASGYTVIISHMVGTLNRE